MTDQAEAAGLTFNPRQLKRARVLAGFTQDTLAWTCQLHPLTVARYEQGALKPKVSTVRTLARVTKREIEYFYAWPAHDDDYRARQEAKTND